MERMAYRLSIRDGQVVAQKEMGEERLLQEGVRELYEYLDLGGRLVGTFVLLHEDVVQILDSGDIYKLDGEKFVLEYPEFMESGKMHILWDDELDEALESNEIREKAVPVLIL